MTRSEILTLPNTLTFARMAAAPILIVLALQGWAQAFYGVFTAAVLSDVIDGVLARRLGQVTEFGSRLDVAADWSSWGAGVIGIVILLPDRMVPELPYMLTGVLAVGLALAVTYPRHHRLAIYHSWSSRVASVTVTAGLLALVTMGWPWLLRAGSIALVMMAMEKVAIAWTIPVHMDDIPSYWHARRLSREVRAGEPAGRAVRG